MPEWPDLELYRAAIENRLVGASIVSLRVSDPFIVRTVDPPLAAFAGAAIERVRRIGKRIAIGTAGDLWIAAHLMVLGRWHFAPPGARPAKAALFTVATSAGDLWLSEQASRRKAAVHLARGWPAVAALDRGGIDLFACTAAEFAAALRAERRTVKRALCDPAIVAAVGNAYSDEILHAARLSPLGLTSELDDAAIASLLAAAREVLTTWRDRLRRAANGGFPERVTAFHSEMAVHGRFGLPCPTCGSPVQRILYADNELNYCARCQTSGRLLSDRALARLLKDSWPRSVDDRP